VASHRLKRTLRGALAAIAVMAVACLAPSPVLADPPPASTDPVTQFKQLSQQADALNEQYNTVKVDLANKQNELQTLNANLAAAAQVVAQAQAQEDQYRTQVDKLTSASFEGAQFTSLSALLTGTSAEDFLERATMLQYLASDNEEVLDKFTGATKQAQAAERQVSDDKQKVQDAANAASALLAQIQQQYAALQAQISKVEVALGNLSPAARAALGDTGVKGVFIAPPGVAGQAMQLALNKRGSPYVWGGSGPSDFDCSGLVMWVYAQLGVRLPHSAQAQSEMGQGISRSALEPGDLVFFGSPGAIHHVGIYVGNGLMVDAPDVGQVVKVEALDSDYALARRLGG